MPYFANEFRPIILKRIKPEVVWSEMSPEPGLLFPLISRSLLSHNINMVTDRTPLCHSPEPLVAATNTACRGFLGAKLICSYLEDSEPLGSNCPNRRPYTEFLPSHRILATNLMHTGNLIMVEFIKEIA